jgi:hypothetical protein
MSTSTVAALTKIRALMNDPRRVVLDPMHLREEENGVPLDEFSCLEEPTRACLLGWAEYFDETCGSATGHLILRAAFDLRVSCTRESWHPRRVDVVDRAIELATTETAMA